MTQHTRLLILVRGRHTLDLPELLQRVLSDLNYKPHRHRTPSFCNDSMGPDKTSWICSWHFQSCGEVLTGLKN